MKNKVRTILMQIRMYRAIKRSGLFDREYYLCSNPDITHYRMSPIMHYIRHGCHEGRNPNRFFDTRWYLKTYPSVARAGVNPLYHYLKHGASEGRDPSPMFSTQRYLAANPDVAKSNLNPLSHFLKHGKGRGRAQGDFVVPSSDNASSNTVSTKEEKPSLLMDEKLDETFLDRNVPLSRTVSHEKWRPYLYGIGNKPGMKILEIGSREVTGKSNARKEFAKAEYVGFDYYPGNNVDVVGDAHKLSSYFKLTEEDDKFDIIYSHACFEHFAMPWIVATEISQLLKVGGLVFIETHFSYSSHERPWHFFQFSDMALKVLFSESLGFKCIEAGMCNPLVGRFSSLAEAPLRNRPVTGLYCHSEYLGKKVKDVKEFDWAKVDIMNVVDDTEYPKPKDKNRPIVAKRAVASVAKTGRGGRFSASRKAQAVLRLLQGEDLELLSRELGVVASTLSLWREEFLAPGHEIKLPPRQLSFSIGGGFQLFGNMRTRQFIDEFGLQATDSVLDVGCGCGRVATYLTQYLIGNYEGFDIMGDCIDWCQKEITPKYPNFNFRKADVYNKHYNPESSVKASEFRFPYEDNGFDFVFLTSVFTHMLPEDMLNYLKEIIRVLKKNGKCIITYFLINEESLSLISKNKTNFKFKQYSENIYVMNDKDPEAAIGFKEQYIENMYCNNEFEIKEIRHGNWCGRESKLLGQDLVYSIK